MTSYTAYLAIHMFESELRQELKLKGLSIALEKERLFLVEGHHPQMIWSQMSAFNLQAISITSINDGAKKLKALGRKWGLFTVGQHRRAQLIQDELPKYNQKPIPFQHPLPTGNMGFWTLWEPDLILGNSGDFLAFCLRGNGLSRR
jgi:23S rRNA (cytidine2498-2'-O)-methyltransferase